MSSNGHAIARGDLRDAEITIWRDRQPDLIVEASQKTLTPMLAVDTHLPADDEAISGEWLASINAFTEVLKHRAQAGHFRLKRYRQRQAIAHHVSF